MNNTFAPVLVREYTGPEANEQYLENLDTYRYSDGYSHFGDQGIYTSYIRTENGETVVYLANDDCTFDRFAPNSVRMYAGPFECREPVRYGIFINDREADFTQLILDGIKRYETRTRKVLHKLIGREVAIIRTGKGPAQVVGYCRVFRSTSCRSIGEFDRYRSECQCTGTSYDWNKDTKVKYLYKLDLVRSCIPHPLPSDVVRHGRTWVEM